MTWLKLFCCVMLCVTSTLKASEVKRIVALAPHIVENLFAIGAGELIVGTVEYADYPEAANEIPRIGGYNGIHIEKLLALKPDLVIAWQSGSQNVDVEKLKKLGIKVRYSEAKDINKVADELRLLGQLTGKTAQAEQVAQDFTKALAQIKARYADTRSLNVFYQLWPDPMMTINQHTWIHQLLMMCQVENIFANNRTEYPKISIENVIKLNPQVIILPEEKTKKAVNSVNWAQWPEVPAVANKQFIKVDADLLHRYSTRVLVGVIHMCDQIASAKSLYYTKRKVAQDNR